MATEKSAFILIEKNQTNLRLVSNILEARLPKSALSYNLTKLLTLGVLQEPTHNVNIYSFEGELQNTEKAFLCFQLIFEYPKMVLTSAPEKVTDENLQAFTNATKSWKETLWYEMEESLWTKTESRLGEMKPSLVLPAHSFVTIFPDSGPILGNEIPNSESFEVKPLSIADSFVVNEHWAHGWPAEKIKMIQDAINLHTSAGVYIKCEESPVAFAVASLLGSINCLHTLEKHRRKGFAVAVIHALLLRFKEEGLIPCAHIMNDNVESQKLFNKLGFVHASTINFICFDDPLQANNPEA